MLKADTPALILAPMEGITDAPMRALMTEIGSFSFCVSEFIRVSISALPEKEFLRHVPELRNGACTPGGLPVGVQILGGDPERMALSATAAVRAGARMIDINFGCPAKTVNRHDGGATLLQHPTRIRDIVTAVRSAVPCEVPVSAKLRLGWDDIEAVYENSAMAAEGGASWITIHARTRMQGYMPPVYWKPIGVVRDSLNIPVVANGDVWSLEDFRSCREMTGCTHFMIGRCALANPALSAQISGELGLPSKPIIKNWTTLLRRLERWIEYYEGKSGPPTVMKFKQWLKLAVKQGNCDFFDDVKLARTPQEFFLTMANMPE